MSFVLKGEQVEQMQRDEASWSNGWWMARFCGPLNAMLRNLAFMVFTKTMEVCKQKKKERSRCDLCFRKTTDRMFKKRFPVCRWASEMGM